MADDGFSNAPVVKSFQGVPTQMGTDAPVDGFQNAPVVQDYNGGFFDRLKQQLMAPASPDAASNEWGNITDFIRNGLDKTTAGGADWLAGKMSDLTGIGGGNQAAQMAQTQQSRSNLGPVGAAASDLAGGVTQGLLVPGGMTNTLGKSVATGVGLGMGNTAAEGEIKNGQMPSWGNIGLNGLIGGVGGYIGGRLGKMFQQPDMTPSTRNAVDVLAQHDIDVTPGQVTRNTSTLNTEAKAGGDDFHADQLQKYSDAVAQKAGLTTQNGHIDPLDVSTKLSNVGQQMDAMNSQPMVGNPIKQVIFGTTQTTPTGVPLPTNNSVIAQALNIVRSYKNSNVPPPPILQATANQLIKAAGNGRIDGDAMQNMISNLGAATKDASGADIKNIAQMRDLLDNVREQYLQITDPSKVGIWKSLNDQYSRLKTVSESTFGRPTNGPARGDFTMVTPDNMSATLRSNYGDSWLQPTRSPFSELTGAASQLLRPFPQTANRGAEMFGREAAKAAVRDLGYGGLGWQAASSLTGGNPMLAAGAGFAGARLGPAVEEALARRVALSSVQNMSQTAGSSFGRVGQAIGQGAVTQNPFFNAEMNQ